MTKADEIEYKVKYAKNKSDEWWIALYEEMQEYLKIAPEEERRQLTQLGYGEMLCMIYDGIMYEREKENKKDKIN